MADKQDQERMGFGDALTDMARALRKDAGNELMYAQADIRHKFEEFAYGHRVTPPWREGHDHGVKPKEMDIHGNGGPEEKPSDIGPVDPSHEERMNTADAAAHIDRNVTRGDNTAREIDAQIEWESSSYPRRPAGNDIQPRGMSFDEMFRDRIGTDAGEGRGREQDRGHAIEP